MDKTKTAADSVGSKSKQFIVLNLCFEKNNILNVEQIIVPLAFYNLLCKKFESIFEGCMMTQTSFDWCSTVDVEFLKIRKDLQELKQELKSFDRLHTKSMRNFDQLCGFVNIHFLLNT